jgi:hypothetical protein
MIGRCRVAEASFDCRRGERRSPLGLNPRLRLPGPLEVFGGAAELVHRLPERAPQFGQLPRAEDDERDDEHDHQLGRADKFEEQKSVHVPPPGRL